MIDTQLAALLAAARAQGMPDLCDLPIPAARGMYRQLMGAAGQPDEPVDTLDLVAPGAEPGATLHLRRYAPVGAGSALPVLLWLHGGGYLLGDLESDDNVCRQLCIDGQLVVVAVAYRLAPEHPFPAAFDDAWAALQWLMSAEGAAALGAGADLQRLAVGGDSAGAVLALSVAMRVRDAGVARIAFLALAYPPAAAGLDGDFPSRQRHADGPTLTQRTMAHFMQGALAGSTVAPDHRLAPLAAPSLARLPPTLLQLAALDPLRDEGLALAQRMAAEGTAVTLVEYHGLAHGYLGQGALVRAARWAQRQLAQSVRDALAAPG